MGDKRKMPPIKRSKGNAWLAVIALAGAVIFTAQTAAAAIGDASDLSNVPMEVRQKSAPASIMYILDDSGSMHDNRVDPAGNLLQQNTANPVPAWLFARHDTNTLYYDPSQQYTPWPGLPAIPLNGSTITAAPNWPDVSAVSSSSPTCAADTTQHLRNTAYVAYNGADGSGQPTRDLTATAAWYAQAQRSAQYGYYYDYTTNPASYTPYYYDVPYGYFPAAAKNGGIDLPAAHYFVCKDKSKTCSPAFPTSSIAPTSPSYGAIPADNELWLVALRYNGGSPQRQFYKVSGLTAVPHTTPSYTNSIGQPTTSTYYSFELTMDKLLGPYADGDAAVPATVRPQWTQLDGSVHTPSAREELENFLQWYVYYSTRNFTAMNALATSLQQLSGVNVGMYSINTATYSGSSPKLRIGVMPVKVGDTDNTDYLLCRLYNFYATDGTTPFAQAYETVGRYFDMSKTDSFVTPAGAQNGELKKPYAKAEDGGSCQQAYVINFTDGQFGYYPGTLSYIPNDLDGDGRVAMTSTTSSSCPLYPTCSVSTTVYLDPTTCTCCISSTADGGCQYGPCPPTATCTTSIPCPDSDWQDRVNAYYAALATCQTTKTIFYPTISDLAKYYYATDLFPAAPDNVPTTAHDSNNKQHLVTYSVALGVSSTLLKQYYDTATKLYSNTVTNAATQRKSYDAYRLDPYFDSHPEPTWTLSYPYPSTSDGTDGVDYLWRASVVSKGIFYNVNDAAGLTDAFKSIVSNIGAASAAVGAAAASSGGQLNDNTTLYAGRYNSDDWTGQLYAYPISKASGVIDTAHALWEAAAKLNARDTSSRLIFTSNGNGKGLAFSVADLNSADFSDGQRQMLGDTAGDHTAFNNNIDYIRGKNDGSGGLRVRGGSDNKNVLGDIIHSSPVLVRAAAISAAPADDPQAGTVYVGANDGMLHAFNVKTGDERFAFIPSQVHDHLLALGTSDYVSKHRYYVDATPVVGRMTFFNPLIAGQAAIKSKDMQLLVSGLGRGGRGYFALDVAKAESVTSISDIKPMLQWEYPTRQMIATPLASTPSSDKTDQPITEYTTTSNDCTFQASGQNNPDGDGELFCANNSDATSTQVLAYRDDDLGYSYSAPVIFPSNNRPNGLQYPTSNSEHPWVVVFGNGYGSKNGKAILYVLDALSGKLIKKIDTGSGPSSGNPLKNGLSSPAALDADGDGLADFVYAGDLYGNLWKFDFRSPDPKKWGVAYKDSASPPQPQPLFTTMQKGRPGQPDLILLGQPITSAPDIVPHNKKIGYIIVFGTGQFLEPGDFADTNRQSLFGIWDSDTGDIATTPDLLRYLGAWDKGGNSFSNTSAFPNASLLEQTVYYQGQLPGMQCGDSGCPTVRIISDNDITWYNNAGSGASGNVGWHLDLPGVTPIPPGAQPTAASSSAASERIIDDVAIRFGNVLAVSFTPGEEMCSAGGTSVLMQVSAFTGGAPQKARLNLGSLSSEGKVYFASGYIMNGKATMPTITPGANSTTEWYTPFTSDGNAIPVAAGRPPRIFFWREVGNWPEK